MSEAVVALIESTERDCDNWGLFFIALQHRTAGAIPELPPHNIHIERNHAGRATVQINGPMFDVNWTGTRDYS